LSGWEAHSRFRFPFVEPGHWQRAFGTNIGPQSRGSAVLKTRDADWAVQLPCRGELRLLETTNGEEDKRIEQFIFVAGRAIGEERA